MPNIDEVLVENQPPPLDERGRTHSGKIVLAALLTPVGAIGLVADFAQIDSLLVSGDPIAVLRIVAWLLLAGGIAILLIAGIHTTARSVAGVLVTLIALVWLLFVRPSADSGNVQQPVATAPDTISAVAPTTTTAPLRTLTAYAADVNEVCQDVPAELDEAGSILAALDESDPAQHAAALPTFREIDTTLSDAAARILQVELPSGSDDRARVEEWRHRYLELRDVTSSAVFHLEKTLAATNSVDKLIHQTQAGLTLMQVGTKWDEVRRTAQLLGITSCQP